MNAQVLAEGEIVEPRQLLDLSPSQLDSLFSEELGLARYRARQVRSWVYRKSVSDFSRMTDISQPVREGLANRFKVYRPTLLSRQVSRDGTRKYLFGLEDGRAVESVLIFQPGRFTLCISSQVGCAMGCTFCRTAQMNLKRHLRTYEIVGQVMAVKDDLQSDPYVVDGDVSTGSLDEFRNIVFMGMGEPLHNFDNVSKAVSIINDEVGLNIAARKITVSTSGLVPAIERFFAQGVPANLAVSLNATSNEVRSRIMPVNRRWPIEVLLQALRSAPVAKNQHITIEYVMLGGINDTKADLERLPKLLHKIPVKLNLIPYNENAGLGFREPRRDHVLSWQQVLCSRGINTRVRWSKGNDISAACGQLATNADKS